MNTETLQHRNSETAPAGGREAEAYRQQRQTSERGCYYQGTSNVACNRCDACEEHI